MFTHRQQNELICIAMLMAGRGNANVLISTHETYKYVPCLFIYFFSLLKVIMTLALNVLHVIFPPPAGVLFLHTYTVVCCTCTLVIGQVF